jgi:hypothetical protein
MPSPLGPTKPSSMKALLTLLILFSSVAASALTYHTCEIKDGPDFHTIDQDFGTNFAKFNGRNYVIHINFGDSPMSTWLETYGGVEVFYTSIDVLRPNDDFLYHGVLDDLDIQCKRK